MNHCSRAIGYAREEGGEKGGGLNVKTDAAMSSVCARTGQR